MKQPKILILEDIAKTVQITIETLENKNYEVSYHPSIVAFYDELNELIEKGEDPFAVLIDDYLKLEDDLHSIGKEDIKTGNGEHAGTLLTIELKKDAKYKEIPFILYSVHSISSLKEITKLEDKDNVYYCEKMRKGSLEELSNILENIK